MRRSALDGLAATVCSELPELGRCYRRALELFVDADEVVRAAAVRVVRFFFFNSSLLGKMVNFATF